MSDPSTLLLLACANCLNASPSASELPDTQCDQIQHPVSANQADVKARTCVSSPETDQIPLHSPKSQSLTLPSDLELLESPSLKLGSRSESVTQLQIKLHDLGHYQGAIDGVYGPLTRVAVSEYQRAAHLKADGIVGRSTWSALQSAFPEPEAVAAEAISPKVAATEAAAEPEASDDAVALSTADAADSFMAVDPSPSTPSPKANSPVQTDSANILEQVTPTPAYKGSQLALLPLGWIAAISVVGGLVLLLKNRDVLTRQWQLQFQDGWALPGVGGSPESSESVQPVVMEQSRTWSRAIVWSIAGVTSFVIIWACGAKVEETVPVQGKLEPKSAVKEVQAPVGGVIEQIHVEEGEAVEAGELLVSFDPTAAKAQLESLQEIRNTLIEENKFYRSQVQLSSTSTIDELNRGQFNISPKLISLTENRAALVAENQLYRAELNGNIDGAGLSLEQKARMRARQLGRESRIAAASLEIEQLNQQLQQAHTQLTSNQQALATNQTITSSLGDLVDQGAYARLPYLQQELETNRIQSEVSRLLQEEQRLRFMISQAEERLQTEVATSAEDLFGRISENEKRIAEIDSQLTKVILENENRINEINSQLSSAELTLKYQELRAPISGVVFNLQPRSTGYVYNSSEQILEIVPTDDLVARVFITNQDIGFVHPGMPVDVRIDSFPFQEFGDIEGELVRIGSDVLPPDETYQFYRFPAEVRMTDQSIDVEGHQIPLHSGMSLSANINIRKRTVITIFFDMFSEKIDSLRRK